MEHLFLTCPFAAECWDHICPQRNRSLVIEDAIKDVKNKLRIPFAMDIIVLTTWSIWIVRNNRIFNNKRPSLASWRAILHEELRLLGHRIKNKFKEQFFSWFEDFT
jgi:hypothetical protein